MLDLRPYQSRPAKLSDYLPWETTRDPCARERFRHAKLVAEGHEARHFGFGEANFFAAPFGQIDVFNFVRQNFFSNGTHRLYFFLKDKMLKINALAPFFRSAAKVKIRNRFSGRRLKVSSFFTHRTFANVARSSSFGWF